MFRLVKHSPSLQYLKELGSVMFSFTQQ